MKSFLWKIRFAVEFKKLVHVSWSWSWETAEGHFEGLGSEEAFEIGPIEAAREERDEWAACCD